MWIKDKWLWRKKVCVSLFAVYCPCWYCFLKKNHIEVIRAFKSNLRAATKGSDQANISACFWGNIYSTSKLSSVFVTFSQIPTSESEHMTHCSSHLAAVSTPDRDNFLQKAEKLGDKKKRWEKDWFKVVFESLSAEQSLYQENTDTNTVFPSTGTKSRTKEAAATSR